MNSEEERKVLFRQFCNSEKNMPVYANPWWLDAVCEPSNWDVLIFSIGDEPVASMPFYLTRRLMINVIKMPVFTQALGPYIKYPEEISPQDKLGLEKKIFSFFIENLPHAGAQFHNFHYSVSNWLPFFWKGYRQSTRYTYVIDDISNTTRVFDNFSYAKKKNIRKAEKEVKIKFDMSASEFYEHHRNTLRKQNRKIVYRYDTFERLYQAAYNNQAGRIIYAVDGSSVIHSAIFCVWDRVSGYNLISSIDNDYRSSGSSSLLIWELIKMLSGKVQKFDFEGSMDEPVENSFRQFGTTQHPYLRIFRIDNPILKIAYSFIPRSTV